MTSRLIFKGGSWPCKCLYGNRMGTQCRGSQMLWVCQDFNIDIILTLSHYSCKMPSKPSNGRWDCDVEKSGITVCLLQCDQGFASKGSHITECNTKLEFHSHYGKMTMKFDPDPAQSVCTETGNIRFSRKSLF